MSLKGKVLEVGFGNGDTLLRYSTTAKVIAIEIDKIKVEKAKKLLQVNNIQNVKVLLGSLENLPFDNEYFDTITFSFALCSVHSQRKSVQELYRVLKPHGQLIAIEHTLSNNFFYRGIQKLISKPLALLFDNCHLESEPKRILSEGKFKILKENYLSFFIEPQLYIEAVKQN
jgi:ubiquinone/menaquinone biosynthesis C-methylase UbiE